MSSPFLDRPESEHVAANALAFAIRDGFPVSPGHTLVIPRRLVATWFEATRNEQLAILDLIDEVKRQLDAAHQPDGYNVGFNAGSAAGQTVQHLHVHVIPRFRGDVDDPRGGVRHVLPGGNYLAEPRSLMSSGGESDPFSDHLLPLLAVAREVAVVAAFVQDSGLKRIQSALEVALRRGATVRVLTGDYLDLTQASALELLLDWQSTWRLPVEEGDDDEIVSAGSLEARVIEVDRLPGRTRSFHPKSWWFRGEGFGVAFVGSSNLSKAALDTGIEWNLRVDRASQPLAWTRVREAFDAVWAIGRPLDVDWVEAYARRSRAHATPLPPGEIEIEPLGPPPSPNPVQQEALTALVEARSEGRRRALVVMATGLGKTWTAAFDYLQVWDELGRQPRLLFVAHRREILRQAAQTWRSLIHERDGDARCGWFVEEHADLDAPSVFASVAKLSRPSALDRLRARVFDYVVVDEVHHAAADSYRKVLGAMQPVFLLGLTATPERADGGDILGLFDDFVAHRADIGRGIDVGRLVPFRYFGLKDDIDYQNIPWRNRRFDPEQLAAAAQTERRMGTLWDGWSAHPGTRSLVFCCSVAHAGFVADWLALRGVRVARVFAAPGSDDRDSALERLARGELDAVCAVDVFNEGVDVPSVDRVVMLRPTESSVVFLQQLGRGLRAAEGKTELTVIDFVGNHQVFLHRLRTLLSLGSVASAPLLARLLEEGHVDLPLGCSVDVVLEAKRLLEQRFRAGGANEVERVYAELRESRGERPTAGELQRMGYSPRTLRDRHGSWFAFVRAQGDLAPDQHAAMDLGGAFLDDLETTEMTKSFKMVTLQAMLEADALAAGLPMADLAERAWQLLQRSPELLRDVPESQRLPTEPSDDNRRRWLAYFRSNPIQAWTGARKARRTWFRVDDDRFVLDLAVPLDGAAALGALVGELVDYRLAQYRRRQGEQPTGVGFVCRVTWNRRDPILKLPPRDGHVPEGEVDVRLPDGLVWQFRLMKEYCNVARPVGASGNQLPDLLRRWFGPRAGTPGTAFQVRFRASPDGWWVEPVQAEVIELAPLRGIRAYPDLRAAAGHVSTERVEVDADEIFLPVDHADPDVFAVRVSGTSMDGGKTPIRDGDWAVFRLARGQPASAIANRVALVQVSGSGDGAAWQIKRVVPDGGGWRLDSDNPDGPSFPATSEMVVVGQLDRAIRPEDLGPPVGTRIPTADLAAQFGLDDLEPRSGRYGGHRFVFVDAPGQLGGHDLVRTSDPRLPGETRYVLAKVDVDWRYLGVGRWREDRGGWEIPEVDFATWRQWGSGREVSRALPPGALARAQQLVAGVLGLPQDERVLVAENGARSRILGRAAQGGLRIDGGERAQGERTVSLTDIAWVVVAADDVEAHGGLLDEARVNRLRYLEGTPKGSTRWIDTGWALAAWATGQRFAA